MDELNPRLMRNTSRTRYRSNRPQLDKYPEPDVGSCRSLKVFDTPRSTVSEINVFKKINGLDKIALESKEGYVVTDLDSQSC